MDRLVRAARERANERTNEPMRDRQHLESKNSKEGRQLRVTIRNTQSPLVQCSQKGRLAVVALASGAANERAIKQKNRFRNEWALGARPQVINALPLALPSACERRADARAHSSDSLMMNDLCAAGKCDGH